MGFPQPTINHRTGRRFGFTACRVAISGLLAVALLISSSAQSQAAGGGWSTLVASNPKVWIWGDCTVKVGIVFDNQHAYPRYHAIGGVQIQCSGYHRSISATVKLNFRPSGGTERTVAGSAKSVAIGATRGFQSGITETPHCAGGGLGHWRAVAVITVAEYGTFTFLGHPNWANITG
jgi:hypothetical protein